MADAAFEFVAEGTQLTGPRAEQNDAFAFGPFSAVVADGMGGGAGPGMVAAEVAEYYGQLPASVRAGELEDALRRAPDALGHQLLRHGHQDGSTVSAAVLAPDGELWLTNAGDSMSVLIRGERLMYVNPLHNVSGAAAFGSKGLPNPYQLNKYIAPLHSFAPELVHFHAEDGDIVILMSDGVHTNLVDRDLIEIVHSDERPASIGYEILRRAASHSLKDNATCVVASVRLTRG